MTPAMALSKLVVGTAVPALAAIAATVWKYVFPTAGFVREAPAAEVYRARFWLMFKVLLAMPFMPVGSQKEYTILESEQAAAVVSPHEVVEPPWAPMGTRMSLKNTLGPMHPI